MLKLEDLPDIILLQIFNLVDPNDLFDLCFLNKFLYSRIYHIIYNNLCNSVYFDHNYRELQNNFTTINRDKIRHLIINSNDDYHYLELCSNITSLSIGFGDGLKELSVLLASKLYPILKKLSIYIPYGEYEEFMSYLPQFKQILDDIECLSINSISGSTNELINYLNPNKLKSLGLHSSYDVDSSTLIKIKDKLPLLKLLTISYDNDEMSYGFDYFTYYDSISKLIIRIDCLLEYFNQMRDLSTYNEIYLYPFNHDVDKSIFNKLDKCKIQSLGYINPIMLEMIDLNLLPNLKKMSIREHEELNTVLNSICLLSTIQTIEFCFIDLYHETDTLISFEHFGLDENENENENDNNNYYYYGQSLTMTNLIQCKFVKHLVFNSCGLSFQDILDVLCFFPNVETVKLCYINFKASRKELIYKNINPILLQFNNVSFGCDETNIINSLNKNSLITLIK